MVHLIHQHRERLCGECGCTSDALLLAAGMSCRLRELRAGQSMGQREMRKGMGFSISGRNFDPSEADTNVAQAAHISILMLTVPQLRPTITADDQSVGFLHAANSQRRTDSAGTVARRRTHLAMARPRSGPFNAEPLAAMPGELGIVTVQWSTVHAEPPGRQCVQPSPKEPVYCHHDRCHDHRGGKQGRKISSVRGTTDDRP
jgi:hypothetical protein